MKNIPRKTGQVDRANASRVIVMPPPLTHPGQPGTDPSTSVAGVGRPAGRGARRPPAGVSRAWPAARGAASLGVAQFVTF